MIFDIVIDILLEGAGAVRAVFAIDGEWDDVKAKRFAEEICGDFAQGERVIWKIPKRLFTLAWFVNGLIGFALVMHIHEEGVIASQA